MGSVGAARYASPMSTSFLLGYAHALVSALLTHGLIEIPAGREGVVVEYLAEYLHVRARGGSLISSTGRALLQCPDVEELYADDAELKDVVDALNAGT